METNRLEILYQKLLSEKTQKKSEKFILVVAITSFLIHLIIIYLVHFDVIYLNKSTHLLNNPIAAIYTPFSFILVYEVYLLIYYLPKSFTTYINKQYEIIVIIIIRRLFKDLSNLTISSDWFVLKYDLQFTYDLITSLLLFYLIYLFSHLSKNRKKGYETDEMDQPKSNGIQKYIQMKKIIATCLVPVLLTLTIYSFLKWLASTLDSVNESNDTFSNINNIFFETFFSVLIMVDVILLLVSFFYTDQFHKVIRNSGFIISTILIRLSFTVDGLLNNLLILTAIIFGLLILWIHNKFEEHDEVPTKSNN